MCLAIPMKVVSVTGDGAGEVELEGVRHAVNLRLIENAKPGDYVIVHAGFAIERLNIEEADARLRLFDELATLTSADTIPPHPPGT